MAFLFIEKGCPILCGWVDEDESFTCTSVVEEIVLLKIRPSCSLIGFILFSLFFYSQWFIVREDDISFQYVLSFVPAYP